MAAPTVSETKEHQEPGDPAPGYHLLVLGPEHAATHQLPADGSVTIGRDEEADVRVVDARASRQHARLHVHAGGNGDVRLDLEDLGSSNGTSLRDQKIKPHTRVALAPGDAIAIGATVLVVQRREPTFKQRRLWPHAYFETRLIEECARAESVKGTFALVRLHLDAGAPAPRCEELLAAAIRSGDILAAYGPNEYELLLVDTGKAQAEALAGQLVTMLQRDKVAARTGVALFPKDGTSPQALVTSACSRVRGQEAASPAGSAIVVEDRKMRDLYSLCEKVAKGTISVLILGETGVGKEILAEAIHRLSQRAEGPFICLNCAALSESLLESELFGYEKGAFTGAAGPKAGLLEAASGGTFFLDEVGEMSLGLQAKMLRAIETRTVLRVGALKPRPVDVRFVAATNLDLEEEVAAKRFREDLFFRLNGISVEIPPLRERPDDVEPLARRFIENVATQMGRPAPALPAAVLALLRSYAWPGNIRELRNVIERAVLLCAGQELTPESLPLERIGRAPVGPVETFAPAVVAEAAVAPQPAGTTMREIERQAILDALARCTGNQTRAAELLGMPRRTFCAKLKAFNISRPRG